MFTKEGNGSGFWGRKSGWFVGGHRFNWGYRNGLWGVHWGHDEAWRAKTPMPKATDGAGSEFVEQVEIPRDAEGKLDKD